jgi:ATP-dependent Lon protease
VTLSGKVLPIGGVKEKVLAAHRAGIRTIILPERNRKEFREDVPDEVQKEVHFEFVADVKQVLDLALERTGSEKAHRNGRVTRRTAVREKAAAKGKT